jgi:SAM-dependent methyltransferase
MLKQIYRVLIPQSVRQWLWLIRNPDAQVERFLDYRTAIRTFVQEAAQNQWLQGCILELGSGQETWPHDVFCGTYSGNCFYRSDISVGGFGRQEAASRNDLAMLCDATNIGVRTASLDGVLCSEVLEHVPAYQLALSEIARVLKPGGRLLITSPFLYLIHGEQDYWRFTPNGFKLLLREHFDILLLRLVPMKPRTERSPKGILILAQRKSSA